MTYKIFLNFLLLKINPFTYIIYVLNSKFINVCSHITIYIELRILLKDIFCPRESNNQSNTFTEAMSDKFADEFYDSSAYTADISTKMRIPEHINAHGSLSNGEGGLSGKGNSALYDMQVPDR